MTYGLQGRHEGMIDPYKLTGNKQANKQMRQCSNHLVYPEDRMGGPISMGGVEPISRGGVVQD